MNIFPVHGLPFYFLRGAFERAVFNCHKVHCWSFWLMLDDSSVLRTLSTSAPGCENFSYLFF